VKEEGGENKKGGGDDDNKGGDVSKGDDEDKGEYMKNKSLFLHMSLSMFIPLGSSMMKTQMPSP
jgi:hypothetical protein